MADDDRASDGDDVPVLGEDLELLREHGTPPMSPERGGIPEAVESAEGALSPALQQGQEMGEFARQGRQEEALWEAFQDLFLTLQETGARAKGALHALAPHCLRPFMRLTPEVVQGEAPTRHPTQFSRGEPKATTSLPAEAHPRFFPHPSRPATFARRHPPDADPSAPFAPSLNPSQSSMRCTSGSCFPRSRLCSSLFNAILTR
jgi:hypothetical protein